VPQLRNDLITVNCAVMYNLLVLIKVTNEDDVWTFGPIYFCTYWYDT